MDTDLDIEQDFEIPQKPYDHGLRKDSAPAKSIPYGPGGFTVDTVLSGDLTQISDANAALPTDDGKSWPEKMTFYLEFCHPEYNTPVHRKQRRVLETKGAFAMRAAEEIQAMLAELPQFPFRLDQIKVVSIAICSRGTVQPRLFVNGFMLPPETLTNLVSHSSRHQDSTAWRRGCTGRV
ncbi:hypothetical protein GSI_14799 [Ganoderma sinense ZZ0214-1]|uniref:Uncharacterized protein n=1 Tax=Ganoderma sinense ZZ0214-1 TaxID=1077348 RepID=A0A2G8RQ70_9APHY|nr:hypothetical protein GSI_14799 [Ganoderma sinense ZZ0214-1]